MSVSSQPQNPKGVLSFFHRLAAVTVCVSVWLLLCINQPFWSSWRAGWDTKKPDESEPGHLGLSCSPVCKPDMRNRGSGVSAVLFWHPLVFLIVAADADGHATANEFTQLSSVFVRVILYAFLHDQICLCGPSIDVCMLAHAFLCMNVHMRVCVWRAEVAVLPHDNRRPKEPLASVLVLQSNRLQSQDLTPLPDVKGCEGWI